MDRSRVFSSGPYSLEFLEKVIHQALEDSATSVEISVVDHPGSEEKLKIILRNGDVVMKNLYYILSAHDGESLGRVVTTLL